ADAALRAQVNPLGPDQLRQQPGEHLPAAGQRQGGELDDEPAVEAVDRAAGQAVPLAEDEPAAPAGGVEAQPVAQADGGGEAVAEEGGVQRGLGLPAVQPDADLALGVVQPAGDEAAAVGHQVDLVAVGRVPLDARDGAGEDPGVSAVEG